MKPKVERAVSRLTDKAISNSGSQETGEWFSLNEHDVEFVRRLNVHNAT